MLLAAFGYLITIKKGGLQRMLLQGKTVLLGITGGIAAYKSAMLCSLLIKEGATVHVVMTKSACEFITPLTLETLSKNPVSVDTFDRNFQWDVQHISLAKKADIAVIAPATANIIAKMATGIADDMLSTTLLAASCPKLVATAMNTGMFNNPVTQRNMNSLQELGINLIHGAEGMLACNDIGAGRMAEPSEILEAVINLIAYEKDLTGKKVLVTAGPTCEAVDPVRYLTNHSSGKMGYALARAAVHRGAQVVLVSGKVNLPPVKGAKIIPVVSAQEMSKAVMEEFPYCDILIKSAAVADYRPKTVATDKIKKKEGDMVIDLDRTTDILSAVAQVKGNQFVCGFSMETENLLENSKGKLTKKSADMIVANSLTTKGAGFGGDSNIVTLITKDTVKELPQLSKYQTAHSILDAIVELQK